MLVVFVTASASAQSTQSAPNVSTVLPWSATYDNTYRNGNASITLPRAVPSIWTETNVAVALSGDASAINTPTNYSLSRSILQVSNALNASVATALSVIPLASPASGVILKTDAATGVPLPVSSTLGPIFTERAETIGKGKFYIGVTHQDYHFTSLNGQSLNNLSVLYQGGDSSKISFTPTGQPLTTVPATFNVGMDVRLSQNVAFLTYGVTDRLDVSLGLPLVHAAVAARTFNGVIFGGDGLGHPTCWCVDTFTPGTQTLTVPDFGRSSRGETGFGDMLLRVKGTVLSSANAVIAVGTDLRFPTGDEKNYLGTGAASVKPFVAVSLYSKSFSNGIVFAPHLNVGWQFSGKSILAGDLQGTTQTVAGISYVGAPFTSTKNTLPDVFSWAVGTEVALGRHNTFIADILGNHIGAINGIPNTITQSISGQFLPTPPNPLGAQGPATGLVTGGRTSFGQYSGAFGYKSRIIGNLVFTFNALVRFDDNGLTARVVPLYGLGYTF